MHIHKQIRDAVVAQVSGLAVTGARVFPSRVYPLEVANLPGLCVYVQSEEAEPITIHVPQYQRAVEIVLDAYARSAGDMEDVLDQIKEEVEAVMPSLSVVGGQALNLIYRGCESDLRGEGDQQHGVVSMLYRATVFSGTTTVVTPPTDLTALRDQNDATLQDQNSLALQG